MRDHIHDRKPRTKFVALPISCSRPLTTLSSRCLTIREKSSIPTVDHRRRHTKVSESVMTSTYLPTVILRLIPLGTLVLLVSCSGVPLKSTPPPSLTPTEITHIKTPQDVEDQLLHTMAEARKLGPANPLLLSTMYSLAAFYREHDEFKKAEEMYQEALALKEHANGPEHQDIAMILHQYAALLRDARRLQEATALEHRARQIQASHPQQSLSGP